MGCVGLTINIQAARAFGKFKESFLAELHSEILQHVKEQETGVTSQPLPGITVHDSDVLEPERPRPGGLMRIDTVCDTSWDIFKC